MKPYLLIAEHYYYPSGGTGDWIDTYATFEEAKKQIKKVRHQYKIKNKLYDVYHIIDLKVWIE